MIKLVTDSSSDMTALPDVPFGVAPLKIVTAERQFVDDETLNVAEMVEHLAAYHGRSSTSCPNPEDWLAAFGDGEEILCFTLTGSLSGAYNAACLAKKQYEEAHPGRRVFVLNTLTTGPELRLIVEKARELVLEGLPFDTVCERITKYAKGTGLLFMLASMRNLANNGRVHQLTAKMAGLLGIRALCTADDNGTIETLDKCRGEKKALESLVSHLARLGFTRGRVHISHCFNEEGAAALRRLILEKFPAATVLLSPCRALCSFYAERGGLLLGFERSAVSAKA